MRLTVLNKNSEGSAEGVNAFELPCVREESLQQAAYLP